MVTSKKRSYDILLGSFVAIGISILIIIVFLIGRERRLFDITVAVEAHFPNVAGLAVGADVMVAGVVVGHVSAIRFPVLRPDMPGLTRDVTVVMSISKRTMHLIKEDSIARIDSKGLLGDKIINISIGSPELPQMPAQGMLKSTPPVDFNKALQQAQEILENVTETVADTRDIFKGFIAKGGDEALAESAKSLRRMFKEIEDGEGVLHELIYDKTAGQDVKISFKDIKQTIKKIAQVSDDLQNLMQDIKQGKGLLHSLVYDSDGEKTVSYLNKSLESLALLMKEIQTGSGIAHDLIYVEDKGQFLRSLNTVAHDLEEIAAEVKSGKGTLGLLLTDPSLYNELYGLIGNLRRNRLLKAIIRHNIARSENLGEN
jgi:phospholipid/cholesterol/gamma-HCH transport system substrate-binding protein